MKQWLCTCGTWVDGERAKHIHVRLRQPTLSEMVAARNAGRDEDALNATVDSTEEVVWRTDFPRRDKPDDGP